MGILDFVFGTGYACSQIIRLSRKWSMIYHTDNKGRGSYCFPLAIWHMDSSYWFAETVVNILSHEVTFTVGPVQYTQSNYTNVNYDIQWYNLAML